MRRIATIMRPGGVLRLRDLIFDFSPEETPAAVDRWLAAAATDPAARRRR